MAGEMKASPRNKILGKVSDKLTGLKGLMNKYEVLQQVPLLGGTGIGDLLMGQGPEEIENWSYGNAPMQVPEMTRVPQMKTGRGSSVADALMLGADVGALGGIAAKLGKQGLSQMAGSAARLGSVGPEPQLGVIKPKGGNWVDGSIERQLSELKRPEKIPRGGGEITLEEALDLPGFGPLAGRDLAINSWIGKTLSKYVKNEMATPEDPVRLLAERGITHRPGEPIHDLGSYDLRELKAERQSAGFPKGGSGKSSPARAWENDSDLSIVNIAASDLLGIDQPMPHIGNKTYLESMPWLSKLDPNSPVHSANANLHNLDFTHLIDELTNATSPDSGLPAELLLKYESLPKVTVPQAVERVAKINEWRAKQKAEADSMRANNAATQVFKEYPEQGYKWVELKVPEDTNKAYLGNGKYEDPAVNSLQDALKYEGETMGHCVGGYCPDVMEGRSKIFSLRDGKGMPHVTVEVAPSGIVFKDVFKEIVKKIGEDGANKLIDQGASVQEMMKLIPEFRQPDRIVQIKGKGNAAPKGDYLPFVQDFVKSQQWTDVGDLRNAGLIKFNDSYVGMDDLRKGWMRLDPETPEAQGKPSWLPAQEAAELYFPDDLKSQENFLKGSLGDEKFRFDPPEGFAQGGLVAQYDPARIEALVSQLMDE